MTKPQDEITLIRAGNENAVRMMQRFNPFERMVASVERCRREDANIVANATHLAKLCARIAASDAPRDFLATHDGVAFLNAVHAMTELEAVYDLARDVENEFQPGEAL